VAWSDIDDSALGARAMDEALVYAACASAAIATLCEPRARCTPAASARHLTRRAALLDGSLAPPALRMARATPHPAAHDPEAGQPHGCAHRPAGAARGAGRRRSPSHRPHARLYRAAVDASGHTGRAHSVVTGGLPGQTRGRRGARAARSRHPKPHAAGARARHPNCGAVSLGLAREDASTPSAASLPPPVGP